MKYNKLFNRFTTTFAMAALLVTGLSPAAFSDEVAENDNAAGIIVSIEAPEVQTSQLPETSNYFVIDFDSQSKGTDGFSVSNDETTYTYSSDLEIKSANQWGGAGGSQFITQEVLESIRSYNIKIDKEQKYFGFWWSAGDPYNKITFKKDGATVAEFKTQDLVNFINSSGVANTANYYGNPAFDGDGGHQNEPFSFVNIFFKQGAYDEIVVATLTAGGSAFESDNHTFSAEDEDIIGTVLPDATTPAAVNDLITTDEDTSIDSNIIDNDIDPNDDLSITKITVGETEYDTGVNITMPSGALLTVESDGSTTYNPNGQFDRFTPQDSVEDSFTYTVVDDLDRSDSATVELKITGLADAPESQDDFRETDENTVKWIPVLKNDSDPDTAKKDLTITSINGTGLNPNQLLDLPSGATIEIKTVRANKQSQRGKHTLKYNPLPSEEIQELNDGESQLEIIEYTVEDGDGKTAVGILEITVTGITDSFAD